MRKILLSILMLTVAFLQTNAQFNNEWIDHNKTYYKFQIANAGIFRISKATLDAAGLGNSQAQHFQLWKNGKQVPLFVSNESGVLQAADYIEFYGNKNDGTLDKALFKNPADHLTDKISLITDTASYFLTINTASSNLRIAAIANDAANSNLTPASHLWKLERFDFKNWVNNQPKNYVNEGVYVNFGEAVYTSDYETGEMMSSGEIFPATGANDPNGKANFNNLLPFTSGGLQGKIRISIAGAAPNNRNVRILLNNTAIIEKAFNQFQARIDSNTSIPLTELANATTKLSVVNLSANGNDRVVAGFAEIDYPRLPDAGGSNAFEFYLPAAAGNTLLEIANFNHGNQVPVLHDLTNGTRMPGLFMPGGKVRFLLAADNNTRQFWLTSTTGNAITGINGITQRTFINYSLTANQANYLIITNSRLLGGSNNPIDLYRAYRSSAQGGSYNAKIFQIEELTDQFAFGVKMHPLSIKNFLRFARAKFTQFPQFCFLIGKGVTYDQYRYFENHPLASTLQLLPTFGTPASDVLLASDDLTSSITTFIGRLNVISTAEVTTYLEKVKQFNAAQANPSNQQLDKAWMKNIVHVVGANDPSIESIIRPYMENYKRTIQDTAFGGKVFTFNKFSSTTGAVIENDLLSKLFEEGFSLLTYFGHSSATALDYNLDDPSRYNNAGKYPVFLLNGCNAGNFFTFDTSRTSVLNTISEKYILAPNRGAIAMIASTHFGIISGLNEYSSGFYRSASWQSYNQSVGRNIRDAIAYLNQRYGVNDFLARMHTAQQTLHGDPAISINAFARPDFSVEASNININPSFLSIAETNFKTKIFYYNLGKAVGDSITIDVSRKYPASAIYPNGFTEIVYRRKVKSPMALDSLEITLPIISERDKGINQISVMLDTENKVAELSELNNTSLREVVIFEDELRPVYPYNFSIINKQNIKLVASSSDPFGETLNYRMEFDTTELFNSSAKITRNVSAKGGIIEFDPGVTFRDSVVYYWRLGIVRNGADPLRWNTASFIYLQGTNTGYNQSHLFQHTKSTTDRIFIDSTSRTWKFNNRLNNVFVTHSIYPVSGTTDNDFSVSVNNSVISASACAGHSMIFNVFDPVTFKPQRNYPGGAFGSAINTCVPALTRQYNFEWDDRTRENRGKIIDFMDAIPNGSYVLVRKILDEPYDQETFVETLKNDEQFFGSGKSIYHRLKSAGFTGIDSFNRARIYIFLYKKNDNRFTPIWKMSNGLLDRIQLNENCPTPDSLGVITSPVFGPAKAWNEVKWRGSKLESTVGDFAQVEVIGINNAGVETVLNKLGENQQDFSIANVSAIQYPFMRLRMRNLDSLNGTPYQLRWWRLYYTPVPEGALAPNILLQSKDTLEIGEPIEFKIAFKNISETAFDSLRLKAFILDNSNTTRDILLPRKKPLVAGDTVSIILTLNSKDYPGTNTLYLAVNPDNDQPEQFFFNNFLYKGFYVREDKVNPLLDVTFDGTHILNRDIVSAKPQIQIKLKDESQFLALNDTAGLTIKLKFPKESTPRVYRWGTDTLRFTPANLASGDNTATVDFNPSLSQDTEGSEYELTVSGKDRNNNRAGNLEYRVTFQVFNKPMISNLLNYPNPFSTSTAFVFTITGQEIPQEFKIQILTVTGKIVKEITKQELGSIRIGTNITDYKWDGTDTYGQKLANGVYLYRVVTSLNGNQMERFKLNSGFDQNVQDATEKFFNKGYGKMVILR